MKSRIATLLAAITLVLSFPVAASAAAKEGSAVIASSVSFRTAPSTTSTVLKYLKTGERIVLLDEPNSYWFKVKDSAGNVGYISSNEKYVRVTQPIADSIEDSNAVIVDSVSFRTKPSLSGSRIRYLKEGERVKITSRSGSSWYAITDSNGVSGYISSSAQYVKLTGAISQPSQPSSPSSSKQVEAVIAAGMRYLGTPYEYGSDRGNTATFDCSDFIRQAFKDALGTVLPSDSRQQGQYVRDKGTVKTDWQSLKRGDLMFFMDYDGTKASAYTGKQPFSEKITHVAIYLGDGKMLHTYSKESGGVRTNTIGGNHWEYRFLFGGSAL